MISWPAWCEARSPGDACFLGGDPAEIQEEMGGKGYFYPLTIIADMENGDPSGRPGTVRPRSADYPLPARSMKR